MSEREMIVNLRKELYDYLSVSYNACISLRGEGKTNASLKSKYIAMLSNYHHMAKYYTRINTCNSTNDIEKIREEITKEISSIRQKYAELKREYDNLKKNNTNKIEINRVVNEMNSIVNLNKMMNEFISKIDSCLKRKTTRVSHINAPLPTISKPKVSKEVEKKEEKTANIKNEIKTTGKTYADKDIREFDRVNKSICDMKREFYKLDRRTKEAESLRKKIYDWCKKREFIVDKICGYDGVNTLINMESIEDDICSKPELPKRDSFKVDSHEYNIKLDYLLSRISDLKFNGYMSKHYKGKDGDYREFNKTLTESISEYNDMIKSVSDLSKSKNIDKISTDIISLLNVYNIDGDYIKFKDANNGGMIGGERVSLESYKEGVNRIRSMVQDIKKYSESVISRNDGVITIRDHSEPRENDEKILETEREKIYKMFIEGKKKIKEAQNKR